MTLPIVAASAHAPWAISRSNHRGLRTLVLQYAKTITNGIDRYQIYCLASIDTSLYVSNAKSVEDAIYWKSTRLNLVHKSIV